MKKLQFLLLFLVVLQTSISLAQKVSNIAYRQEQSNIIVSYDLETKTPCKVNLFVSTDGGITWQGPLTKVSGDVGDKIASGSHNITWNVLDEFEQLSGTNIKFQVRAEELKTQTIASINKALIKNPKNAKLYKLRGDLKYELVRTDYLAGLLDSLSVDVPKGAIADYSKAILLNPKYAEAYYSRGNTKRILEDYDAALFDYTKAVQLQPKNTEFIFARAEVKKDINDFIGSIDDANKVIELDSTYQDIYYIRGVNRYNLNDFEGANYDFEKHVKNSNNPISEYNRIASWRFDNNDYKTAIVYFTKATSLLAKAKSDNNVKVDTISYLGSAFLKYKLKDYDGANSDFKNFIEQYQDKSEAYNYIAQSYIFSIYSIHDYENAKKYLTKAIELNPNKVDYFKSRAEVNERLYNYRGAVEDYSKAIELNPTKSWYFSSRASAKEKSKNYIGAIEDYTEAIELDPAYSDYYSKRAQSKGELNDYRGAIDDYAKAIELNPHSFYFNYRAQAKFNLKDYRGAIADYTKAILLDPSDSWEYYSRRGVAKYIIGDFQGAIADYNKSILQNSRFGWCYLNRGNAKLKIKDKKGACKDFSLAGELGVDSAYEKINENCKL